MSVERPRFTYAGHLIAGVALVVIGFLLLWWPASFELHNNIPVTAPGAEETGEIVPEGPLMAYAEPVRLTIPRIGIDTAFSAPLGLAASGEVEVPDDYVSVGWYKHGPTPGQLGPAVVLGHVDSVEGPAVFFSLGQLESGDDIYIERADGSTAHFAVTVLERYEQIAFPTARIYGDINHAGLRLITCSGLFQRGEQRYTHNLVVFARLVTDESADTAAAGE